MCYIVGVDTETFAQWSTDQRKRRGLTQVQLAGQMGVNQATVSSVERGETVTADYAVKLARALRLPTTVALLHAGLIDVEGDDRADVELAEIRAILCRLEGDRRETAVRWLNAIARDIAESERRLPYRKGSRADKTI